MTLSTSNAILLLAMGLLLILAHTRWPVRFMAWKKQSKRDRELANELDHYCVCCEEGLRYMRKTGSHGIDHPGDCTYDPRGKYRGSEDDERS